MIRRRSFFAVVVALACGSASAQDGHKWLSVQADDGSAVKIDMTALFVFHPNATTKAADTVVYFVDGKDYKPLNMRRYIFYCGEERYKDVTEGLSTPMRRTTPHTMAAKVSETVCAQPARGEK